MFYKIFENSLFVNRVSISCGVHVKFIANPMYIFCDMTVVFAQTYEDRYIEKSVIIIVILEILLVNQN